MQHFSVTGRDGTRVAAWRGGDPDGIPVAVSPGLGSPAEVWGPLLRPGSGFAVRGVGHRGLLGGEQPGADDGAQLTHWADDLEALMDAEGLERPLVLAWSLGVNAATLLALRAPERVAGLLGVCGVPSGTFAHMGAPWRWPHVIREPAATAVARTLQLGSPVLGAVTPHLPARAVARALRWGRFVGRDADNDHLGSAVHHYLHHEWQWFFTLALTAARQPEVDVSGLQVPVTLLGTTSDLLTSGEAVMEAAAELPHCRARLLEGTHFLPFERPDVIADELRVLARRAGLEGGTRLTAEPSGA